MVILNITSPRLIHSNSFINQIVLWEEVDKVADFVARIYKCITARHLTFSLVNLGMAEVTLL